MLLAQLEYTCKCMVAAVGCLAVPAITALLVWHVIRCIREEPR